MKLDLEFTILKKWVGRRKKNSGLNFFRDSVKKNVSNHLESITLSFECRVIAMKSIII